jgi:DNA polymerase I-like protein with 3'-5' exonuclease and polymerase domains
VTPAELLAALRVQAEVRLVDGQLEIGAPHGALTPELRTEIAWQKQELVAALEAEAAAAQLTADGRDILAALACRGISVRLGNDGRPLAGPADLVDEADWALLAAHRDAVLAALATAAPEQQASADGEQPDGTADAESRAPGSDRLRDASTEHGAIHIEVPGGSPRILDELAAVLTRHPGSDEVLLHFVVDGHEVVMQADERFRVTAGPALQVDLEACLRAAEQRATAVDNEAGMPGVKPEAGVVHESGEVVAEHQVPPVVGIDAVPGDPIDDGTAEQLGLVPAAHDMATGGLVPGQEGRPAGAGAEPTGGAQPGTTSPLGEAELHVVAGAQAIEFDRVVVATSSEWEHAMPEILAEPVLGLDTEATGLDPFTCRLRLVQLAARGRVFLVDAFRLDPHALQQVLDRAGRLVGQNLKFDLRMLMAAGLRLPADIGHRLSDTMLAGQLLGAGIVGERYRLVDLARRYLGVTLDKSEQVSDWSVDLTEDQLAYAARDAAVLLPLRDRLRAELERADLGRVALIESRALPAMAWLEQTGAPFDQPAWLALAEIAEEQRRRLESDLDALAPPDLGLLPLAGLEAVSSRWSSPAQVLRLLESRGVVLPDTRDGTLQEHRDDDPLIPLLLEHRDAAKRSASFGREFLRFVHPVTGRVHADYFQSGTAAGRMAARQPNVQQLPRDPAYRTCVRAPEGRVLVKCDYAAIEMRLAAEVAGDARLIEAFDSGADVHRLTAAMLAGKPQDAVTKGERQLAKACFSGDTEILTRQGWVRFDQYDGRVEVAQFWLPAGMVFNPSRGSGNRWGPDPTRQPPWDGCGGIVEFVAPVAFQRFDGREVWYQRDRNSDLLCTPDHEIVFVDNNKRPRKLPMDRVTGGNCRHLIAAGRLACRPELDDLWSRLLAMTVADGSFKSGAGVRFGFSKPRKIQRCRHLLDRAGISYREMTRGRVTSFKVTDRRFRERLLEYCTVDKDLLWRCLADVDGDAYLDEAAHWDGHCDQGQSRLRVAFGTTRRQTADVMQAMCATHGIPSTLAVQMSATLWHKALWNLSYRLHTKPLWRASWAPARLCDTMTVYCVQVPSGAILVRRNGRVVVAGNCNFGLLYGMGAARLCSYARFAYGVEMTDDEAVAYRERFFETYEGLRRWHRSQLDGVVQTRTLAGRRRLGVERFTEKLNSPVQGAGADGLKLALGLLHETRDAVPSAAPILVVHDEIVLECDENDAERAREWLERCMRDGMGELLKRVPVEVEGQIGFDWSMRAQPAEEAA